MIIRYLDPWGNLKALKRRLKRRTTAFGDPRGWQDTSHTMMSMSGWT